MYDETFSCLGHIRKSDISVINKNWTTIMWDKCAFECQRVIKLVTTTKMGQTSEKNEKNHSID